MKRGAKSSRTAWPPFNAVVVSIMDFLNVSAITITLESDALRESRCREKLDLEEKTLSNKSFSCKTCIYRNQLIDIERIDVEDTDRANKMSCELWGRKCKFSESLLNRMRATTCPEAVECVQWLAICLIKHVNSTLFEMHSLSEIQNELKNNIYSKIDESMDIYIALENIIYMSRQDDWDDIKYIKNVLYLLICKTYLMSRYMLSHIEKAN